MTEREIVGHARSRGEIWGRDFEGRENTDESREEIFKEDKDKFFNESDEDTRGPLG